MAGYLGSWGDGLAPGGGGGGVSMPDAKGGTKAGTSSSQSQNTSTSKTYLPGEKLTAFEDLRSFLANPMANIMDILAPMLQGLRPSEDAARRSLSDEFRKAGASNSGAFAASARAQENEILNNRWQQATKAGLQYLAPIIQGRVGALQGIPALSESFSQGTSSSQAQGFAPQDKGGRVSISSPRYNTSGVGGSYDVSGGGGPLPGGYYGGGGGGAGGGYIPTPISPEIPSGYFGDGPDYYAPKYQDAGNQYGQDPNLFDYY
jgi:hypothetical protein